MYEIVQLYKYIFVCENNLYYIIHSAFVERSRSISMFRLALSLSSSV